MTMTTTPIALALAQAEYHQSLARDTSAEEERRAHTATMRALDKAVMEMAGGNVPRRVAVIETGVWMVNSRTNAGTVYRVDLLRQTCTCANGRTCWHLAAANVCEEAATRDLLADEPRYRHRYTDDELSLPNDDYAQLDSTPF